MLVNCCFVYKLSNCQTLDCLNLLKQCVPVPNLNNSFEYNIILTDKHDGNLTCFIQIYNFNVISGPDYIRQKYNEPVEVKEVPGEDKKEKSPTGSPHFYRKGTTPTQSPSQSPGPSPTASPTAVKKTFFNRKTPTTVTPAGKENKTTTAESLTAGKQLQLLLI